MKLFKNLLFIILFASSFLINNKIFSVDDRSDTYASNSIEQFIMIIEGKQNCYRSCITAINLLRKTSPAHFTTILHKAQEVLGKLDAPYEVDFENKKLVKCGEGSGSGGMISRMIGKGAQLITGSRPVQYPAQRPSTGISAKGGGQRIVHSGYGHIGHVQGSPKFNAALDRLDQLLHGYVPPNRPNSNGTKISGGSVATKGSTQQQVLVRTGIPNRINVARRPVMNTSSNTTTDTSSPTTTQNRRGIGKNIEREEDGIISTIFKLPKKVWKRFFGSKEKQTRRRNSKRFGLR